MGNARGEFLKSSLVRYIGLVLGFINVTAIYTFSFTEEELGFVVVLGDVVSLVLPFTILGFGVLTIRYFPLFEDKADGHNGFLGLIFIGPVVGYLMVFISYFIFRDSILATYAEKIGEYIVYFDLVLILLLFRLLDAVLSRYLLNFQKIYIPTLLNEILPKVLLPLSGIAYYKELINFSQVIGINVLTYIFIGLGVLVYTMCLGEFNLKINFKKITPNILGEMTTYVFFGIIGSIGASIVLKIDTVMLTYMIGLGAAGIYTIPARISMIVEIPKKILNSMVSKDIVKAWSRNDLEYINASYKKLSLIQLVIGIYIFLGVWACVDDIYSILPNSEVYVEGKSVILFLGMGMLVELGTSINEEIIGYSKYFRYNFYFILILGILTIVTNIILIPIFGLIGAAIATAFTKSFWNIMKSLFLYYKFKLNPLSNATLIISIIGASVYFITCFVPDTGIPFMNIFLKGILVSLLFLGSIIYLRVSEDFNQFLREALSKLGVNRKV